jgi:K(+)-stimulated pyrophosphate-energized sodium pump
MIGVITAVIGIFSVAPRKGDRSGMTAINRGFFVSAIISLVLVAGPLLYLPAKFSQADRARPTPRSSHNGGNPRWLAFGAVLIGIVLASAIQLLTGYFTETNRGRSATSARARRPARPPSSCPGSRPAWSPPSTRRC